MRVSDSSSDRELLDASRDGDTSAFSVLWSRHQRPALVAAHNFTTRFAAEDVVAEAYLKIFELVSAGKGPTGAFRPYLYRVVRSVAIDWLRNPENTSDPLQEDLVLTDAGPWEDGDFDRNAAARAFQSLNSRWQEVLWYTEVDGLPPREVAKLIGTNARNVSALASRAREELRSAWVEEHVNREFAEGACRLTITHLQRYKRGKLTAALRRDVEAHLPRCESCTNAAAEYTLLNRHLALVLATIFLGGVSATSLLQAFGRTAAETSIALGTTGAAGTPAQTPSPSALKVAAGAGAAKQITFIAAASVAAAAAIGAGILLISPSPGTSFEATEEVSTQDQEVQGTTEDEDRTPDNGLTESEQISAGDPGTIFVTVPVVTFQPPHRSPSAGIDNLPEPEQETELPGTETPDDENGSLDPGSGKDEEADANLDPSITIGFECYLDSPEQGYILTGTASEYGALRARVTQPPAITPVLLITYPTVTDQYGNTFENVFSGTDPMPSPWWWAPPLAPLEQWPGLTPGNIEDVFIELQLLAPDGRYSPWILVELNSDCQ